MLYTSPFDVLNLPTAELQQMDRKMLQLKKKQLLAELQLQPNNVLLLSGKEFTKNDIVQLFDQLEQDDALAMHAAIATDPALLQFLQTGKLRPGQKFNYNPLYQSPEFIEFVSPFYKEAFNRYVLKALAARDYYMIEAVFANPILLSGAAYDDCFGKINGYLEEKLQGVERMKQNFAANKRTNLSDLHDYYIFDWITTLNKLPDAFENFRDDYAGDLYNFAVDLWNGKRRDEARALLYGIESIHCSANIKHLINSLIQRTVSTAQPAGSSGGGWSSGNTIWLVISLFILIFRIGNSCSKSSSNDYNYLTDQSIRQIRGFQKLQESHRVYVPFTPFTKRDKAMFDLLITLNRSVATGAKAAKPTTIPLANGSNPYEKLFAKPIFTQMEAVAPPSQPTGQNSGENEVIIEADKEPSDLGQNNSTVSEGVVEMAPKEAIGPSPIDINNKINFETIVFFYSANFVNSVYVKPQSNCTVTLPQGLYHTFCFSGTGFSSGLPLKIPAKAYAGAKKDFAGMGRFAEPNSSMLFYLLPKSNITFLAGVSFSTGTNNAAITIDFTASDPVTLQPGKSIDEYKMPEPSSGN